MEESFHDFSRRHWVACLEVAGVGLKQHVIPDTLTEGTICARWKWKIHTWPGKRRQVVMPEIAAETRWFRSP